MIDYKIISDSIGHYSSLGYSRIESPWTVTPAVSDITKPTGSQDWMINHNGKVLVASGEQSFLYLYLKEFLPQGRFQSTTPCYRYEPFDETHSKYFIKNELIDTLDTSINSLNRMISDSVSFFKLFIPENQILVTKKDVRVPTNLLVEYESYDIEVNINGSKVEIGSYGIRECSYLKWVYGTGCAEPRTSKVLNLIKKCHIINQK